MVRTCIIVAAGVGTVALAAGVAGADTHSERCDRHAAMHRLHREDAYRGPLGRMHGAPPRPAERGDVDRTDVRPDMRPDEDSCRPHRGIHAAWHRAHHSESMEQMHAAMEQMHAEHHGEYAGGHRGNGGDGSYSESMEQMHAVMEQMHAEHHGESTYGGRPPHFIDRYMGSAADDE